MLEDAPPLINITSGLSGEADWCKSMSSNAVKQIASIKSVKTVILATNWHLYFIGNRFQKRYDKQWEIRAGGKAELNSGVFERQIKQTIDLLISSGKNVIVIKQTPELSIDPASCLTSRLAIIAKNHKNCEQPARPVKSYLAEYEIYFDKAIPQHKKVKVIDPLPVLCSDTKCLVMDGAYPIFRDDIHLSRYGSFFVFARLGRNLPNW